MHLSKLVLTIGLVFFCFGAYADYKPKMSYAQYHTEIRVHPDGSDEQTIELLMKIETQAGVSSMGEQTISFNSTLSNLEVLEAYTIKPNGDKVMVDPDKIRTQDDADDGASNVYSDSKVKLIIYPNVEVGSQLYYKAHLVRHTPVFEGQFYWTRLFSPYYRYEDVQVDLILDPGVDLNVDTKGFIGGTVESLPSDPKGTLRYHHQFVQNTAYPSELGTVSLWDFAPYYSASTFKSYKDVGLAYQKRAKPMAQVTPEIEKLSLGLTRGLSEEREKVKVLYNWVSRNVRYIGIYAGAGGYVPHEAESILKNQYGDCKDHVTLLESMLAAVGIESTPVLINSEKSYVLPKLASPGTFDHVITFIPSMKLFLDSTAQYAPIGSLPDSDMNKPVLLTATGDVTKTRANDAQQDYTTSNIKLVLMDDGTFVGKTVTWMYGSDEIESRIRESKNVNQDQERLINRQLGRFMETGTGEIKYEDPGKLDQPWKMVSTYILDPLVNLPGPGGFTIPYGLSPATLRAMSTYRPPAVRRFPAVCETGHFIEKYELTVPKKLGIIHIPRDVHFKQGDLKYESRYVFKNQMLTAIREMTADRTGLSCNSKDDEDWNAFAAVLKRDLRQQILFN